MANARSNNSAQVSYSLDANGEFYIDVQIEDYSEEAMEKLSLLVASIGSDAFEAQTMEILRLAFAEEGKDVEFTSFLSRTLLKRTILSGKDMIEQIKNEDEENNKDKPIIKPTDLL